MEFVLRTSLNQEVSRIPLTDACGMFSIEKVILSTNSMIEAFGNAVTIRNDNSSRFGKFVQLEYDEDGVICGAQTRHFLLEKSRIVSQGKHDKHFLPARGLQLH